MVLNSLEIELREQPEARCSFCRVPLVQCKNENGENLPLSVQDLEKTFDKDNKEDAKGVLCPDCENAVKNGYPRDIKTAVRVIEQGGKKILEEVPVNSLFDKPKVKPEREVIKFNPKPDKKKPE